MVGGMLALFGVYRARIWAASVVLKVRVSNFRETSDLLTCLDNRREASIFDQARHLQFILGQRSRGFSVASLIFLMTRAFSV
jgi:hypothetical protein